MQKKSWNKKMLYTVLFAGCLVASSSFTEASGTRLQILPMGSWTGIGTDMINGSSGTQNPAPSSPISRDILQMGTGAAKQYAIKSALQKVSPALVGISFHNGAEWIYSGSGVIYAAEAGLIVTNAHVVSGSNSVNVTLHDNRNFKGIVIGKDIRSDLAVVKINAPGLLAAEFGDSSDLHRGEPAVVLGNPVSMDYQASVNVGVISGLNRHIGQEEDSLNLIQTDAPINPGNSGGALANGAGQVIGINTSKLGNAEGIGFAIPINTVKVVLDRITKEGSLVQSISSKAGKTASPIETAIERISPSIVGVSKSNKSDENLLSASGIVYKAEEGLIVTSYAGIKDAKNVFVNFEDGRSFEAEVVGADEDCNLAVLRVEADNLKQPSFGDSALLSRGDTAIVIGSSVGLELNGSVTVGIISGLNREQQVGNKTYTLIQTDAALNEGNGGSALLNEAGQIIGINIAKSSNSNTERIGFAIPINTARVYINDIIKQANANRPYLGMNVSDQESGAGQGGVVVLEVMVDSPAHKAGLKAYDKVLSINGKAIYGLEEVSHSLQGCKVGDVINVKIIRDKKPMNVKVLLEALPE